MCPKITLLHHPTPPAADYDGPIKLTKTNRPPAEPSRPRAEPPPPAAPPAPVWPSRSPAIVGLLALLLLIPGCEAPDAARPTIEPQHQPAQRIPTGPAVVELGQDILRHDPLIRAAGFSDDQQQIITADDQHIHIADAVTGQRITRIAWAARGQFTAEQLSDTNSPVLASPDLRFRATRDGQGRLSVHDQQTDALLHRFTRFEVVAAGFSDDSQYLAVRPAYAGRVNLPIALYRLPDMQRIGRIDHTPQPFGSEQTPERVAAAVSPDGSTIAYVQRRFRVVVENIAGQEQLFSFAAGRYGIDALLYTPDGGTLIAAGGDQPGTIRFFETRHGALIGRIHAHDQRITSLSLAPGGMTLASASHDGTIRFWDVAQRQFIAQIDVGRGSWLPLMQIHWSATGQQLLAVSSDRTMPLVWSIQQRGAISQPLLDTFGHSGWITTIAFSPDGQRLVTAGRDRTVRLWDSITGQPLGRSDSHRSEVTHVAFKPDSRQVVSVERAGTLMHHDTATGRYARIMMGEIDQPDEPGDITQPTRVTAINGDGRWRATLLPDRTIHLQEIDRHEDTAKLLNEDQLFTPSYSPRHLAMSHDGSAVVAISAAPGAPGTTPAPETAPGTPAGAGGTGGAGVTIQAWHTSTALARYLRPLRSTLQQVESMAVSHDGSRLAVGGQHHVELWDLDRGTRLHLFQNPTARRSYPHAFALAFDPTGRWLAAGYGGGRICIWDVQAGELARLMRIDDSMVLALTYASRGDRLAAAGSTGQAVILRVDQIIERVEEQEEDEVEEEAEEAR